MKNRTFLFTLLLAMTAAFGCSREEFDSIVETTPAADQNCGHVLVPFSAEAGQPETRVEMNGSTSNIVFSAGDQLMVYSWKLVRPSILTLKSGAGSKSAVFTGDLVLAEGKAEADLAGRNLYAVLLPAAGVSAGVFSFDASERRLTVDYSSGSIDSDLEALVSRTILYEGRTTYEARKFSFEMQSSYIKMNVTVPSEESDLARDYTVHVTYDYHIRSQATNSGLSMSGSGESATVEGSFHATGATGGTLYMAVLAAAGLRIEDDTIYDDEVKFQISMDNDYKEYDLVGGVIDHQIILPGKGYTRSVTLTENLNQDVLLGQPASVHDLFMTGAIDKNGNHWVSKYEAAQVPTNGFPRLIGYSVLTDASFLKYFTGLDTVPYQNFMNCTNLTRVTLPKNITLIDDQAFSGCSALQAIIIPGKVKTIDNYTFSGCTSLSSVYFTPPSVVETIGAMAFSGCAALQTIVIPSTVQSIYANAFNGCTSLQNVTFSAPSRLSMLGTAVFKNCTSLAVISLPSRISAIPAQAFMGCIDLERVSMGTLVESVGSRAFEGCSSLTSVLLPATSVTSIGRSAFAKCTSLQSMSLPSRLKTIDEYTFNGCTSLSSVTIPYNVETIAAGAFQGCALTEIVIPGSVTSIKTYAFGFCSHLATVYCNPETPPDIDNDIFYNCASNLVIYVPSASLSAYRNHYRWHNYNIQKL